MTKRNSRGARALLTLVSFQLALGPQATLAQAAPAPADAQTSVTTSANGAPVVNIATPNAAGVSHNRYSSYDVDSRGLILNNSATNAVSLLGGGVAANGNLANGVSARLILNEVIAPNAASTLAGYQEVLGPAAELVIANPWGISCNGCGFVNTPRVTLTTGTPRISPSGALSGFTITGGQIAVTGEGLDASRQQTLDLLARGVSVTGNIIVGSRAGGVAGDLLILGGASEFDYAARSGTALPGSGAAGSAVAIDSSALGGMYADRIRLLVDERGAGVRAAGNLAALADDLSIDANGHIEMRGAASAARDVNVRGESVLVQLADANTYLYGGRDLNLTASAGTLTLGSGSIGAQRNVSLAGGSLFDTGGAGDLRFSGDNGVLDVAVSGALDLSGGFWTAPRLSFSGANANFGSQFTGYGRGNSGNALSVTTPGVLSIAGGALYSDADAALNAQRVEVETSGVVAATGALTIGGGSGGTSGNSLLNNGILAGGTVTVDTAGITNTGTIQAASSLALQSLTLENLGAGATIIGSTSPSSSVSLSATHITNSGTIWSAGDLTLRPTSLTQQRAAGATGNPLIAAGRDLTLAYTSDATLGTGDLQAGRDLTITAASLLDLGATGAASGPGSFGDLRAAGRNLTATANAGHDLVLAGGQWYSNGDLNLTGDDIVLGRYFDTQLGTYRFSGGLQVVGAQSGSGSVALNARNGSVQLASDTGVFSGADLDVTQTSQFMLPQFTQLQAAGTLSIAASTLIDNYGEMFGDTVSLASSNGLPFDFINQRTGVVFGEHALRIGTSAARAGVVGVLTSAPGAQAGLFGGVLDIHAAMLINNGTIQAVGAGSTINADLITNNDTGVIQGYTDASGQGGLTLNASSIANLGQLYDSSHLTLNVGNLSNTQNGSIASSGLLQIVAGGTGALPVYNAGTIGGYDVDLFFSSGLQNGADPGDPGNRSIQADIFASHRLGIRMSNGSTLLNYGTLESDQDLSISYVGGGAGTLSNQMSMLPASELMWVTSPAAPTTASGDYGLLTEGANGSTDKHFITVDGTTYYYFGNDFATAAYLSRVTTWVQNQTFDASLDLSSIHTPTIRAGNDLSILGFEQVLNNGTIEAAQLATIRSSSPTSTLQNTALRFGQRDLNQYSVDKFTCQRETTVGSITSTVDWGCGQLLAPNKMSSDGQYSGYTPNLVAGSVHAGNVAFAGRIFAGTLDVAAGSVTNSGAPQAFVAPTVTTGTQLSTTSATQPVTLTTRAGASSLTINGAQVSLPTTSGGRFITAASSTTKPLIETNPQFGIDSVALGSDYLAKLLGLKPEQQTRRLGDDNYEVYLIGQQVKSQTGRSVLQTSYNTADMVQTLFDNAAAESQSLGLGYGKALTAEQISALKSDIVWLVEQEVQGQKVLVPVVYLTDATRSAARVGNGPTLAAYDVNIEAGELTNTGGDIAALNSLKIKTSGNIENLSGRLAGWNVQLDAGGDIVNSTLMTRVGDAQNGHDVAQRVASIEAGNTAILKAGRDIDVKGAWVVAAKDAALIAGHNVNVTSLAMTTNERTGNSESGSSKQEQTALGAGVVAGGNTVLRAGQDLNLTAATVAAGGTAALRAENGNVNVGVLELQNRQSTSSTTTGMYTQLDTDRGKASATLGIGVEHRTKTETTTTTTGVGSTITGAGVLVSTGKGDVNVIGSSIEAGEDGLLIDSARDVNILAYNETSEQSTSTNRTRAGLQLDASADEVLGGAAQSGNKKTTTTTQTTARTSQIKSGGNVVIKAGGTVANEGTSIEATGDVALLGDEVVNRVAKNTLTTTTTESKWEAKQQEGLTTNGTGASINNAAQGNGNQVSVNNLEWQQRITGSYSTQTDTTSSSQAVGTQIKSGGNVIVNARGKASDEGTQYTAGKNIVIAASDYENKAAADTTTTSTERTSGSGRASVGLNTSVEVAINASAEGGQTTASEQSSTARTGSLKAGGAVIVQARSGDVRLEGTQIEGQQGVGISAARDIQIDQANDTTTKTSTEQSGSGRVSASVSLIGTGGSVGAGATTRLADSQEQTSTARAASIKAGAGNVQLDAGRDLTSQGANIEAGGDVALKAGRDVSLLAATDRTDKTGSIEAGGSDVNVGFGTGAAKGNGGISASVDFEKGKTDYHETTERGSTIKAGGNFSVDAGRDGHLQGTQVDAQSADLKTGGNLTLESAKHLVTDNSSNVNGHIELSGSKGGGTGGASSVGQGSSGSGAGGKGGNAAGGNAQVNVARSIQDIDTNTNATINTRGGTRVDVGGDLSLKGANVNAQGGVIGQVAGNLNIETRVDKERVDQTDVKAYAGAGPIGGSGGGGKFQRVQEGAQTGANAIGQTGAFTDVSAQKKDNLTVGTASGISGGASGVDLRVGGNTTLTGAANSATDFKTQGTTTIQGVETRTSESDTKLRLAGTVASAAGSDKGKGGDFGATLNVPGARPPTGAKRAPADAGGEPSRPTQPSRPRAGSEPAPGDNYANSPGSQNPRPASRPGDAYAPANDSNNVAQSPRPRANSEPSLPSARPAMPRELAAAREAVASIGDNYANDPAPQSSRPVRPGEPNAPGNGPTNAPTNAVANPPSIAPDPIARQAHTLIEANDRARALRDQSASLDAIERKDFERNLAEIAAFQNDPRHSGRAAQLFADVQDSLAGPRERNGFTEFPLRPQYVGENEVGFDSWKTRPSDALPGARYGTGADPLKVRYFTPEQQQQNRVYVTPDGKLTNAGGALSQGTWMFVVDTDGRMIAVPFPKREDLLHHSSLSAGKPVRMAGKFRIDPLGRITSIENESGHFRPDQQSFERFLVDLKTQGVNLNVATAPAFSYTATENNRYVVHTDNPDLLSEPRIVNGGPSGLLTSMHAPGVPESAYPARPTNVNRPQSVPVPPEPPARANEPARTNEPVRANAPVHAIAPFSDREGLYNTDPAPSPQRPNAESDVADLYHDQTAQPQSTTRARQASGPSQNPAEPIARRLPTLQEAVQTLVTQDATVSAVRDRGARLTPEDRTQFERNLAEIVAFTNQPEHASQRGELLKALEVSAAGPRARGDGLKVFPLQPRYVGENVAGFDNWSSRAGLAKEPGARYAEQRVMPPSQRTDPPAVTYFSAEQQKQAQVFVRADGQLGFANGKLADGDWIFVVDESGRLLATRSEQGKVHHSSLSSGNPVMMAGDFKIVGGKLTKISNQSGHFRPDADAFKQFLAELKKQKVTLTGVTAPAYGFDTQSNGGFATTELSGNVLADPSLNVRRLSRMLGELKALRPARSSPPIGWQRMSSLARAA